MRCITLLGAANLWTRGAKSLSSLGSCYRRGSVRVRPLSDLVFLTLQPLIPSNQLGANRVLIRWMPLCRGANQRARTIPFRAWPGQASRFFARSCPTLSVLRHPPSSHFLSLLLPLISTSDEPFSLASLAAFAILAPNVAIHQAIIYLLHTPYLQSPFPINIRPSDLPDCVKLFF